MMTRVEQDRPFYVEFEAKDAERFRMLAKVFDALRTAKQTDHFAGEDEWLKLFDEQARKHFWWPTDAEIEDWRRRWFSTPLPQRWTDPSLKMGWTFGSMIMAFENGEYDLLECRLVSDGLARIEFDPHSYPYGGNGCMKALIEAFGFRVVDQSEE